MNCIKMELSEKANCKSPKAKAKAKVAFSNFLFMMTSKPARLQVDPDLINDNDKPQQTGNVFNIWFLKWSGGESSTRNYTKLKFRVDIASDSGYTKADKDISKKSSSILTVPICLFYARGCCYLGKKCSYLHRLPKENDYFPPTQDCFGRDKTADYQDDMNGVGALNKRNSTLYVSGLHMSKNIESIITNHFEEFGKIVKVRVLYNKGCAFVSYRLETEAQFAKEAMQCQSLDDNEVLIVRWASEDPDPKTQQENKRKLEEITINTIQGILDLSNDEDPIRNKKIKSSQSSVSKDPVVEEPEEVVAEESQQMALPVNENSGFFDKKTMDLLSKKKGTTPRTLVSGYSSSDDDDDDDSDDNNDNKK